MKVLLSVASLRTAYGGPAFSVSQLAGALAREHAQVGLWAPDGSAPEAPVPPGVEVERLTGSATEVVERFGRPDVLHDNGIWLPHNHALAELARRSGTPRVVSVRGMLEPWARRHKGLKKALAWGLYQRADLRRAQGLHATAGAEARTLAALHLGPPVHTIANGVELPPERGARSASATRMALFLGRIYPVKGLPMLIEAWARTRPQGWRLKIAGPDEAGHRAQVERAVQAAGLGDVVAFTGPVSGGAKDALFAEASLFILPSHTESFGMVVAEALSHAVPVLTTTAVPWPMLEERACGWRVDPNPSSLAEGLARAAALPPEALAKMGANGRLLVAQSFSWESAARSFLAAYDDAMRRV